MARDATKRKKRINKLAAMPHLQPLKSRTSPRNFLRPSKISLGESKRRGARRFSRPFRVDEKSGVQYQEKMEEPFYFDRGRGRPEATNFERSIL